MTHDINYHGPVVVLDLDDTLYAEADYVMSAHKAIAQALQRRNNLLVNETFELMQSAFEKGENAFDTLLGKYSDITHRDSLVQMCVEIYRYHQPCLKLPQASRMLLEQLRQHGIKAAIVTDGRATTQWAKIKALGVDEYVAADDIWVSGERGADKLSVEPWRFVARRYPEAKGFYAIGDNPAKDFYMPNMLGFTTICLENQGRNIHSQAQALDDLHQAVITIQSLPEALSLILSA